jgi:hypothetical protein
LLNITDAIAMGQKKTSLDNYITIGTYSGGGLLLIVVIICGVVLFIKRRRNHSYHVV